MVRTNCAVSGCYATSKNNKELQFHRFPNDDRAQSWITTCQRPDLNNKTAKQLYNMHVCSLHFEKWMYIKKKLKDAAVPILNLPATTNSMEESGAQNENGNTSPSRDLSAEPSTSANSAKATPLAKKKKQRKKSMYRTTPQTKEVVFNIHQHYQKRKWNPGTWEYEVDLNINRHVAEITGLSEKTVGKIARELKESMSKDKTVTSEPVSIIATVKQTLLQLLLDLAVRNEQKMKI